MITIENVNEEGETYEVRVVPLVESSAAVAAALSTLNEFPNDTVVIRVVAAR